MVSVHPASELRGAEECDVTNDRIAILAIQRLLQQRRQRVVLGAQQPCFKQNLITFVVVSFIKVYGLTGLETPTK